MDIIPLDDKYLQTEFLVLKALSEELCEISLNDEKFIWLSELLNELHKEIDFESKAAFEEKCQIYFKAKVNKKALNPYGSVVFVDADIDACVYANCSRCLVLMAQSIKKNIKACFIHESYASNQDYSELDEIYSSGVIWELYHYTKQGIKLSDFIIEQLVLEMDSIPLHDKDCLGLCQQCGANLNLINCSH